MSRASKQDELVARIDADIAQIAAIQYYIGVSDGEDVLSRCGADIERLQAMRDYVTAQAPTASAAAAEKPKRTRKRKGLPAAETTA